jgi:hypothetical protein
MDDSPPRGTSWRVWALVSVTVALLSGPVIPRVIDHMEQAQAETAGPSLPVSSRLLTSADLQGKSSWDLDVLRNEIYARHGRRFANPRLQSYFESQPWYHGRIFREPLPARLADAGGARERHAHPRVPVGRPLRSSGRIRGRGEVGMPASPFPFSVFRARQMWRT